MRSALEWAQVRALAADGLSQREIAARLGINRRTVARLAAADEPPRYRRARQGSQLDPFEPVLRRLLEEWPQIKAPRLTEILRDDYGYTGSLRLVQERLRELRPRQVRPAQRTGYRPGQVLQLDWAEMPTRPRIAGRERRVYALIASLPYSGAQTAFFSLDLTIESFLEGHVRAFEWLGGVPRECVYDNLRSVVARRELDQRRLEPALSASARPLRLPRDGVHAGDAAREGIGRGGGALPQERLLARATLRDARRARRAVRRLARPDLQPAPARDPAASSSRSGWRRSARSCGRCRRRASTGPGSAARGCRWTATCATAAASIAHRSDSCTSGSSLPPIATRSGSAIADEEVARYRRSYEQGVWLPPPIMRPEPPTPAPVLLPPITVAPPELADYAELCG